MRKAGTSRVKVLSGGVCEEPTCYVLRVNKYAFGLQPCSCPSLELCANAATTDCRAQLSSKLFCAKQSGGRSLMGSKTTEARQR